MMYLTLKTVTKSQNCLTQACENMRVLRTIILGAGFFVIGCILGGILWYLMGAKDETHNWSFFVWFPCNLIPLASLLFGLMYGWKSSVE